jgi:hypothetical protein
MRIVATTFLLACVCAAGALAQDPVFLGAKLTPKGFFGIGIENPGERLHVNGNALVTGVAKGAGYQGRLSDAFVFQGFAFSGATAQFAIMYDDVAQPPGSPQAIQILNVQTNVFKTFIIDHPVDRERYLVHATLEGPEGAVYYRGSARLENGRAVVALPPYFEALTRREGRTILLTNVDGFDLLAVRRVGGEKIRDGRFVVESSDAASTQEFDWEVKAVRADGPPLGVEPLRKDLAVSRFGPYTYGTEER